MAAYYNEIDPYTAQWLRNLIAAGHIAPGDVDERSIVDVRADDLRGYSQCHFFAGIGGWSYALRLAGWGDDRPVWTGSCPCQPFSLAGKQKGFDDERHLWPVWRELIRERRPANVFGEQVASATAWLGLVRSDLEAMDYAVGCLPIQAASAGADHLRDRYWFVGHAIGEGQRQEGSERAIRRRPSNSSGGMAHSDLACKGEGRQQRSGQLGGPGCDPTPCNGGLADAGSGRRGEPSQGQGEQPRRAEVERPSDSYVADSAGKRRHGSEGAAGTNGRPGIENGSFDWVIGADGKARRVKPGIRLLAHGIPARVGKLRAFGNAIDPRPAAEFIAAAT